MNYKLLFQPVIKNFHINSLIFRRALRCAIVVSLTFVLSLYLNLSQAYWVPITALIVMQTTVGATLRRGIQRFIGTLLGVMIGSILLIYIHNIYVINFLLILFLFISYYFNPFNNLINYGLIVIPLSIMMVFMLALVNPEKTTINIVHMRIYDTIIGASIGIAASLFLFPNKVKGQFATSKQNALKQLAEYFEAIINLFLNKPGSVAQARLKKALVETALLADRQYYLERIYEIHVRFSYQYKNKEFLNITEKIAQLLFAIHHIARYPLEKDLLQLQQALLLQLKTDISTLLLDKNFSKEAAIATLDQMQSKLANFAKQGNVVGDVWYYLAPLASVILNVYSLANYAADLRGVYND